MASRRRYAPPKYRDGGAVPIAAEPPLAEIEREAAPARADEPQLAPPPDEALRQAIEGQRRAEELQRQPPQPVTIEASVDGMPGLSEHKRAFLKRNAEMLQPERSELMREAYAEAMQAGIPDDSEAMDKFLIATVNGEMQARRARLADAARQAAMMQAPSQPLPTIEKAAEQLEAEAAAYHRMYVAEHATPAALAPLVEPPPIAARRSMPMTAPVSRDVPMASGQRMPLPGQITLTAEERFIARHSYSDPSMSDAAREAEYARQKARLARLRHEGLYPERERG